MTLLSCFYTFTYKVWNVVCFYFLLYTFILLSGYRTHNHGIYGQTLSHFATVASHNLFCKFISRKVVNATKRKFIYVSTHLDDTTSLRRKNLPCIEAVASWRSQGPQRATVNFSISILREKYFYFLAPPLWGMPQDFGRKWGMKVS